MQTIYLVTGLPGVGKTSFLQVLEGLKLLPEYSVTPQSPAGKKQSSWPLTLMASGCGTAHHSAK